MKNLKYTILFLFVSVIAGAALTRTFYEPVKSTVSLQAPILSGDSLITPTTNGDLTINPNGTGGVIFDNSTATTVPYFDANKKLTSSAVTPTELGYLGGVIASVQTQFNNLYNALPSSSDFLQLAEQSSAPSTPSSGNKRLFAKDDGKLYTINSVGAEEEVGSGAGGGATGAITGDDSNIDATIGGWLAYADAAGTTPVDGTGGSPTVTCTRNTSSPLHGDGDLLITKDAADRQGEGCAVEVPLDPMFKGKPVVLSFKYSTSANFDYGTYLDPSDPSDIMVYILDDATTDIVVQPNPSFLDGSGIFRAILNTRTDTASVRAILHIATTNAAAYTVNVDDVELDIASNVSSPAVSDMVSGGALTISATTTPPTKSSSVTTDLVRYRVVGDHAHVRMEYRQPNGTGANSGSGDYLFKMPSNLKIDLTKVTAYSTVEGSGTWLTDNSVGHFSAWSTANNIGGSVVVYDADYVRFFADDSALEGVVGSGFNGLALGNVVFVAEFWVPIQGATSGYAHPAAVLANTPAVLSAYKNGGSTNNSAAIASWTGVYKDSVGGFNSSTGKYTVKSPGDYFVSANWNTSPSANATQISIYVNGSAVRDGISTTDSSDTIASAILPDLKYGDVITVVNVSGASRTGTSADTSTHLSIAKISGNHIYALPDKTQVKYLSSTISSATNPVTDFTFSNLTIGKMYEVSATPLITASTSSEGNLLALHNGVTLFRYVYKGDGGTSSGSGAQSATIRRKFIATATTLTFQFTESTVATLEGDGTASASWVSLTELNNTVQYSGW